MERHKVGQRSGSTDTVMSASLCWLKCIIESNHKSEVEKTPSAPKSHGKGVDAGRGGDLGPQSQSPTKGRKCECIFEIYRKVQRALQQVSTSND